MDYNFIDVYFRENERCKRVMGGVWQYDYGQVLRIHGLDLPDTTEFQFAIEGEETPAVNATWKKVNGVFMVDIPDDILKRETTVVYTCVVYAYVKKGNSANTERVIRIGVYPRPKRRL